MAAYTYFAVSPCERFVKVGRSRNPAARLHSGDDVRRAERGLGIDRVRLFRAYGGGMELEREALAFMAKDRVAVETYREWFRVGPRFRVLVSRLDRRLVGRVSRRSSQSPAHRSE